MNESSNQKSVLWISGRQHLPDDLRGESRWDSVDAAKVGESLAQLLGAVDSILNRAADATRGWDCDEVTLGLEVSSSGRVGLFVCDAEVGGKAAIELKLRRAESKGSVASVSGKAS